MVKQNETYLVGVIKCTSVWFPEIYLTEKHNTIMASPSNPNSSGLSDTMGIAILQFSMAI